MKISLDDVKLKKKPEAMAKQLRKLAQKAGAERIKFAAKLLQINLVNTPNLAKSLKKTAQKPNDDYFESSEPLKIFFRSPDGVVYDSGLTSEAFLQSIRGGYRAKGAGSYMKEKVQTRARGSHPPGTYADENQKPGEFFEKGTGKVPEKYKPEAVAKRRAELREKEARKAFKATLKERRALMALEKAAKDALKEGDKKREKAEKRLEARRQKAILAKAKRAEAREKRLEAFENKQKTYRIVVPGSRGGYVEKPAKKALFRKSQPAGAPPNSWSGGGKRHYFLSRAWTVTPVSKTSAVVRLIPQPYGEAQDAKDDRFLQRLETGGAVRTSRYLVGYIADIRDGYQSRTGKRKYMHKRVSFLPVYSDSDSLPSGMKTEQKTVKAPPHPYVAPAIEKTKKDLESM